MLIVIKVFPDHIHEILNSERLGHKLIATSHLGFTDIFLEGVGAEGDDRSIVIDFLDNTCGVETIHFRHADIHQNQVGMLILIQVDGLNAIMGSQQTEPFLEYDFYQFIVTVFVLSHENCLLIHIVRTGAHTDGTHISRCGGTIFIDAANGTFEGKYKGKGRADTNGRFYANGSAQLLDSASCEA